MEVGDSFNRQGWKGEELQAEGEQEPGSTGGHSACVLKAVYVRRTGAAPGLGKVSKKYLPCCYYGHWAGQGRSPKTRMDKEARSTRLPRLGRPESEQRKELLELKQHN